jgi:ATP-binding cassette, subfamily B, bacterial
VDTVTDRRLPAEVRELICRTVPNAEIRLAAESDIGPDGQYGERWIALAGDHLVVCEPTAQGPQVAKDLLITDFQDIGIEALVGGGMLQAVADGRATDLIPFTNSLSKRFGRLRGQLDAIAKGKPIPEEPEEEDRCPTCGLLLREGTKVCPRCLKKGETLRRLLGYAHPYRSQLALVGFLMLTATAAQLVSPYLTKILVDGVIARPGNSRLLVFVILGMLSSSLLSAGLSIWRGRLGAWLGARISFDIRAMLYDRLQWLSMRYYDRHPTGAIISRITQDAGGIQDFLGFGLPMAATSLLQIIGITVAVFLLNWQLALLALLPTPFATALTRLLWRRMRRAFHQFYQRWSRFNTMIQASLTRTKIIKAFSQQPTEIERFGTRNNDLFNSSVYAEQTWTTAFPLINLVIGSGTLIVWYFGTYNVWSHRFTLGELMAFLAYLGMIYGPLNMLTQAAQWMPRALTAAERVFEVLDAEQDSEKGRGKVLPKEIKGEIEFRNVTFGYQKHQPVLKDVSFKVEKGKMLGLVGRSGAGKSTIINLICRFYDVDEGDIIIDGVSLRDLDLSAYRGRLGAVLQDPFLFGGTVAENIAYGKPDATIEEIMAAARIANAHDFIINKPDGYDEQVGENGSRLSGGEKQRVCIARAILHNPAILILDEATANVDLETESQIQEAIARLIENRTTFAIAHRLSTLRNAHKLLVMEDGKIAEFGTHEELENKEDGVYRKLLDIHRKTSMVKAWES